jgi:succinyl-CoA synthetase alpha subunit
MSILADKSTRLCIQGLTGHARLMMEYGTHVVAGVTPGKGGDSSEGIPVFDTVSDAASETHANASVIFVPGPFAADAVIEAADAGIELIVCITEGIPTLDVAKAREYVRERGARLIGPNCPGLISPGECKIGIMPGPIHRKGPVGVISRSGTLTYEAIWQLTQLGIGQSTAVGIGGDLIIGTGFVDLLDLFENDEHTKAIVLIGEIGGTAEEEAAEYIVSHLKKPVVAFVAGRSAPPGRRMGHAGAIISGSAGTAESKIKAFRDVGVAVEEDPSRIGQRVKEVLGSRRTFT